MNNEKEYSNPSDPSYELDEIILTLEAIQKHGSGSFNFCKAVLTLAKEIKEIKKTIEYGKVYQRFR